MPLSRVWNWRHTGGEKRGGEEEGGVGGLNNSPKSADDFRSVETWPSGCWAGATVVRWCLPGREIRTVYRNKSSCWTLFKKV